MNDRVQGRRGPVDSKEVHRPVLLEEVLERLAPSPGELHVDATLGGGGHAEALRGAGLEVLAIDRDPDAIAFSRARLGDRGIRYLEAAYDSAEALDAVAGFHPGFILLERSGNMEQRLGEYG